MELKRVIALDMRTANEKAIALYGENVLVISSERVDNHTELIVAVDLPSLSESTSESISESMRESMRESMSDTCAVDTSEVDISAPVDLVGQNQVMSAAEFKKVSFAQALEASSHPEAVEDAHTVTHLAAPASLPIPLEAATEEPLHEAQHSRDIVNWLREEFDALKRELLSARWQADAAGVQDWSEPYRSVAQALSSLGLPSGLRAMLMGELQRLESADLSPSLESTLEALEARLLSALKMPTSKSSKSAKNFNSTRAGLHVLAGPSGAGKTSLICRLALAAAGAQGPASQAIVSYRDARAGAWSQLQTLAAQAGIDCYRAPDEATFQVILTELSDRKTVWVDTPGLNYMDIAQSLKDQHHKACLHAVLPVDATLTSAARVVVQGHGVWSSLMLTKLDEAAHPWPLIAALTEFSTPVSWVSEGAVAPLRAFEAKDIIHSALAPLNGLAISQPQTPAECKPAAPTRTKKSTKTSAAASAKVVARMTPRSSQRARAHA